jgi:hypothetical protein
MKRYVRVAPGVATERVDDEALAYDGDRVFRFTGTGALVWSAIPVEGSPRDVVGQLATTFDDSVRVAQDVSRFVDQLLECGLVEELAAPERGYRPPDHVGWLSQDDAVVLVDLRDGRALVLSTTGSRIWELVTAGVTRTQVVEELSEAFDVEPDVALRSALTFLEDLVDRGLLSRI